MSVGHRYILFLTAWYFLSLKLAERGASDDVAAGGGPRLQFKCLSGGQLVVVNPNPELFKHAFVTLEGETDLLPTKWGKDHRTLTINLSQQANHVLVSFSTRGDVVSGNNGIVYRITCTGYTTQIINSGEGMKEVESIVRQGGVDGKQVTSAVVGGFDLFWTIHIFDGYTMMPLNCTISAGEKPFYSESVVIIINGCSTDHWIMDDFTGLQTDYGNDSLYYTRLHTFRFYSNTYLTVLCRLRVCPAYLSHWCLIACDKMKRYFASEPGQPADIMYTHIEFTLLIEYLNTGVRGEDITVLISLMLLLTLIKHVCG